MAITDIEEKKAEERKREKRLVHVTNAWSRAFLDSKAVKSKKKLYRDNADYIVKSFLDYLFFEEKKEIRELSENHVQNFLVDYAPRKLNFTVDTAKDVSDILAKFLIFLNAEGHIKNGTQLSKVSKGNNRTFLKLIPKTAAKRKTTKASETITPEVKVGRNDPCPCGSGKKYKKCCGRLE